MIARDELDEAERQWAAMTERQKITSLRRAAEQLRSKPEAAGDVMFEDTDGNGVLTAQEVADAYDGLADRIEAGEDDEEESPEQLEAEAKVAKEVAELLRRSDVSSLEALLERLKRKT